PAAPAARPPAFVLPKAPKEPLKEMPLPQRAHLLSAWIAAHPKPTSARVRHFLFQHTWIVTGASFGWWHGAEALRELIAADRLPDPLRALPARRHDVRRERHQVRGLPHYGQRLPRICAHPRLRLSRVPPARLSDQPERQLDRPVRAHRHGLPDEQHEDLR